MLAANESAFDKVLGWHLRSELGVAADNLDEYFAEWSVSDDAELCLTSRATNPNLLIEHPALENVPQGTLVLTFSWQGAVS